MGSVSKYTDRQDLLGLALDIHGAYTGSFPDLSDEDLEHARAFIQRRVSEWVFYPGRTEIFDSAVKALLLVTLYEASLEQESRAK